MLMRRRTTLLVVLCTLLSLSFVQAQTPQVNNGGFENWTNLGGSSEEPTDWNSFMTASGGLSGFAAQQIRRSVGHRPGSTGSYSAIIWSKSTLGVNANGNFTTGQVNMGSSTPSNSSNYNWTNTGDANFSETLGARPDSIEFWIKYKPGNSGDLGRVNAVIHDSYNYRDPSGSDANSPNHVVGSAALNFSTTSNQWVRKCLPFTYSGPATNPDYILVTFTTCMTPGGCSDHDSLYVDDLRLIYNPTLSTGAVTPLVYYVSATQGSSISVPFNITGTMNTGNVITAQLSNSSGSFSSPVSLGTLSTTASGSVSGTIPAGTVTGSGYRIRVISTNYPLTAGNNGTDIQINLVSNTISPSASQVVGVNTNGTTLTVSESTPATSRVWKYSTTPGGPYFTFSPSQTGASYTPNFNAVGTYYVICESIYPGSVAAQSNEVEVTVVSNTIAPAAPQSVLVGAPGTLLTVTENPSGSSREWKYSATSGGPYSSFSPVETNMTYIPLFMASGTYYVVCESVISGTGVISNEVEINVGAATLNTGVISGSPFQFSPSAPDANIVVPYTISDTLNAGNTFTAQLSDASGGFSAPVNIGFVNSTISGSINAVLPHGTPAGTGYRIRVVSSSPVLIGTDNGTDLIIDQFNNSVTPSVPQSVQYNVTGSPLTVTESQSATRVWMYATVSGGPYAPMPLETAVNYSPFFAIPGTYYVVCASTNTYADVTYSNEVEIDVTNGQLLNTSSLVTSGYYVSPNAVVMTNVNFTSDIIFTSGNVFTAELSDANGSFGAPVVIGTRTGTSVGTISCTIPNITPGGTGYRIRVTSSNPPAVGTDNGADLSVIPFASNVAPLDTQYLVTMANGVTLNVTSTHPSVTHEWKYRSGAGAFLSFSPVQTGNSYTPYFATTGTRQVTCYSINQWNDTVKAQDVLIFVSQNTSGIDEEDNAVIIAYWNDYKLFVNLTASNYTEPVLSIFSISGQAVMQQQLNANAINTVVTNLRQGVYIYRIQDKTGRMVTGKFIIP